MFRDQLHQSVVRIQSCCKAYIVANSSFWIEKVMSGWYGHLFIIQLHEHTHHIVLFSAKWRLLFILPTVKCENVVFVYDKINVMIA